MCLFGTGAQVGGVMTRRYAASLAAAGILAATASGPVRADEKKWTPWIEAGGTLSTERDYGEVTGFAPLLQTGGSLLFADVKGKLFSEDVKEGNFALGYRAMTAPGWNLGAWAGYDIRESEIGNTFEQVAFGVEALSADYDFRLNGYVSTDDPKSGGGLTTVQLSGTQIVMTGGSEVPLSGFEGEVGFRVPLENIGMDRDRHELRLYAGGYRFDADELSEPLEGPRLRAEWRLFDIIPSLAGSQLSFESQFQHDDYRDDQWEAGFRLRIPLFAGDAPSKLSPIERRMAEPLVRDTDIVTAPSRMEKVADAVTGTVFDRVATVDGTGDLDAIAGSAGANSLVIVDGGNGDLTGAIIPGDQTIAGGGSSLALRGVSSGTLVTFDVPGTTPRILAQICGCDILTLAGSNTHLTGLLLDGEAGSADFGVYLEDDQKNLHFTNMEIREVVYGIGGNDANEVSVDNVAFYEDIFGIYLDDENTVSVTNSVMDVLLEAGIYLDDDNIATIRNVSISRVDDGDAVRFDDHNVATIDGLSVEDVWDSAITADNDNTIVASNVTSHGTGWNAINLNTNNRLTLSDSLIEFSDADGILGISGNTLTISGTTLQILDGSGIYIEDGNTLDLTDSLFDSLILLDVLTVGGTGNVLSGSGNEDNAFNGGFLCNAAPGSFTGSIEFDNGPDIVDGSCP